MESNCLKYMEKLVHLDDEINILTINWIKRMYDFDSETVRATAEISGSISDGCSLARFFHPDNTNLYEIELDLLRYFFTANDKFLQLIEPVANKPDNVKILFDKNVVTELAPRILHKDLSRLDGDYMNPRVVREILADINEIPEMSGSDQQVHPFSQRLTINYREEIKGACYTNCFIAKLNGMECLKWSTDNVPAIRLNAWPEPAKDFTTRNSRKQKGLAPAWPEKKERYKIIMQGCDVVPKSSLNGDHDTEWRWSFSCSENHLLQNVMTSQQKRSYFLAKIILYKHVKPASDKPIPSYWIKTAMFWFCEDHPGSDEIWKDENLKASVRLVYEELLRMLQAAFLPHFFITKHSLLAYSTPEVIKTTIDAILPVIDDVETFTPSDDEFDKAIKKIELTKSALDLVYQSALKSEKLPTNCLMGAFKYILESLVNRVGALPLFGYANSFLDCVVTGDINSAKDVLDSVKSKLRIDK